MVLYRSSYHLFIKLDLTLSLILKKSVMQLKKRFSDLFNTRASYQLKLNHLY